MQSAQQIKMIYKMFHVCLRWFILFTISALVIFQQCSPIPLIQSPRINAKLAVSSSIKSSGDSNKSSRFSDPSGKVIIGSKETFVADEKIPRIISFGIRDRVEISGGFLPFLWIGTFWQGNLKVSLFDIGEKNMFKNIAAAVFGGSSGYRGEHDDQTNYYAGFSVGSITRYTTTSIELVLQSSISQEKFKDRELDDMYVIQWFQPAFGIIFWPGKKRMLEINCGVNYSYPIDSDVTYVVSSPSNESSPIRTITSTRIKDNAGGGLAVLAELRFNIIR